MKGFEFDACLFEEKTTVDGNINFTYYTKRKEETFCPFSCLSVIFSLTNLDNYATEAKPRRSTLIFPRETLTVLLKIGHLLLYL